MLGSLIPLIMYGWIPVTIYLFIRFPPQRAVIISFLVATLFLPQIQLTLPGNIQLNKITVTCIGVLLATLIYEPGRLSSFTPGWLDLPAIVYSIWMIPSQITNGLSPISPTINHVLSLGVPYFLGRIYLNDLAGLRQLAMGFVMGGLVYAPLCLWESRMGPNLHAQIYGFSPRTDFLQAIRLGGFRPTVFMEHGLAVGMWMMAAALAGVWLWQIKAFKQIWNIPANWVAGLLVLTHVLCRSTGAYIYMVLGLGIFFTSKWFRTALPLLILIVYVSGYIYLGATGTLYTIPQVDQFMNSATDERSGSYAFRLRNEKILSEKARERVIFGWGGSGGNTVKNAAGQTITTTDSLWIIAYGVNGAVGLAGFAGLFLLPAWSFFWFRYPASNWFNPKVAPVVPLAVILPLYMLDCSLNAFSNPMFVLASGGISGLLLKAPEPTQAKRERVSAAKRPVPQRR